MKEKPIIFSTDMIKAILDGRKSQTRLVIKPQPNENGEFDATTNFGEKTKIPMHVSLAPYNVGDILWVRETWAKHEKYYYRADSNCIAAHGKWIDDCPVGEPKTVVCELCEFMSGDIKWKPSIHMPRAAARIFLRVTAIRAERLQAMSGRDMVKEGICMFPHHMKKMTA